ncbi:PH domain-containing protein [Embleya sp. NPDC008237]|uniref:PH domain-containing protein n=1 Tax=Embleya sp. NPDC008237 TaxID=3363978 RepID=UPI0036EE9694
MDSDAVERDDPTGEPTSEPRTTVEFHRRVALVASVSSAVVAASTWWWLGTRSERPEMVRLVLVVVTISAVLSIWTHIGRTRVGPDGITTGVHVRSVHIPWEQVASVSVNGGAVSVVSCRSGDRPVVLLAAPSFSLFGRERRFRRDVERLADALPPGVPISEPVEPSGSQSRSRGIAVACLLPALLAVAFVIDRPWTMSWWSNRHEVASVAPACELIREPAARLGLYHESVRLPGGPKSPAGCDAESEDGRRLTLAVHHFEPTYGWGPSATESARKWFDRDSQAETRKNASPVPGLGDAAYREHSSGMVTVTVRRANVIVTVSYLAPEVPPEQADRVAADAERLAREVTSALRVG